jgi:uncharacterized membrane protein (DUF485 family)
MQDAAARALMHRIAEDPRYRDLVARRARFAWTLAGVMVAIFLGFLLLVAFDKALLGRPIGDGATTLGIPIGLGVILAGIALTALYVRRANRDFDPAIEALRREYDA